MAESKFCAGCLGSDKNNTGEAWCFDCAELVCKTCSSFHKKLSPPHKVVPIEKVSRLSSSLLKLSRHCEFHNDQKIVIFCCQHDQLVCDSCVSESHQNCKPVLSIEKAAHGVQEGTAVTDLEKRIDKLTQIMEHLLRIQNREVHNFSEQKTNIKKNVADIKTKIISHLDKLEADLNKSLDIKFNECSEHFMKNKSDIQRKYDTMKTWKGDLTSLKDYASNIHLFHAIKNLDAKTHRAETAVRSIKTDAVISKLTFKPSEQISKLHDILPSLGVISLDSSSIPILSDLDIDQQGQAFIRAELSKRQLSLVTSFQTSNLGDQVTIYNCCFAPDNKLFLCHNLNNKVYLCDHDVSNTKTINLDYCPRNVTLYDTNTALVSAGVKGIQIIDLKTLKPGRIIKIGSDCAAITSFNGKIWVKSDRCTLSLIDIKGKNQEKVKTSFDPWNICLTKSGDIYYTDNNSNVYVVTSGGEERIVYSSPKLEISDGITVDDHGDIYIAGNWSNNIHRISSDGQQSSIILTEEDGINYPTGLSFNHQTQELMVVNDYGNCVNIYKVS